MRFFAVGDLLPARPQDHSARPGINRIRLITTGVKLLASVQAAVHEVRGDIHQQRPLHGVSNNQGNATLAKYRNELRAFTTCMTNLNCMTDWDIGFDLQPRTPFEALIMATGKSGGLALRAWQQVEEVLELFRIECKLWWKLPKNWSELLA
jgi:hypothetical protein